MRGSRDGTRSTACLAPRGASERSVDEASIRDRKFLWLDISLAQQHEREFSEYCAPHLDTAAMFLSLQLGFSYFQHLTMEDHVFFLAPGRKPFGLPKFQVNAPDVVVQSPNLPDLGRTAAGLRKAIRRRTTEWLTTVQRWHLEALGETDRVKQFLWSYLALEILAHKLSERYYGEVVQGLTLHNAAAGTALTPNAVTSRLVPPKDRLTVEQRFTIAALKLFPQDAVEDVRDFTAARTARDELAHGAVRSLDAFPTQATRRLIQKYLSAAISL